MKRNKYYLKEAPWLLTPMEHRAILARETKEDNIDKLEDDIADLSRYYNNIEHSKDTAIVASLYRSEFTCMYLTGFIFGGASDEEISDVTGLRVGLISLFRYLFVDLEVVESCDILLRDYIWRMPDGMTKQVYMNSVTNGWQWTAWRYSNGTRGIQNEEDILRRLATDSYWRSKEGIQQPITSFTAKEAKTYTKQAADMANSLRKEINNSNALSELELTLTADNDDTVLYEEIVSNRQKIDSKDILH